ncbi:MAG TPA: BlaI/MecI/CopY family transcriptional regulator [Chthoniobacterales bacterium]
MKWHQRLTRRERQVMDIVLAAGEASAAEIHQRLPEPPSYSAVRALLRVMEEKGHLVHVSEGPRYVYKPAISPKKARASVLQQLLDTLFEGSREELVAALLDSGDLKADKQELDRLAKLIEEARQQGR